jgi:predicted acyltransferase
MTQKKTTDETTVVESQAAVPPNRRLLSIDYFRGLAVLLMLIYDYVPFFTKNVPILLQHGRTDMLLFGDLVAPFFLFIMGLSLAISVSRQRAKGVSERDIFLGVLRRAILLFILGLIIDETRAPLLGGTFGVKWGVLETLGVSYLVTYVVMLFKPWKRIAITTGLLSLHLSLLTYAPYADFIKTSAHGSPLSILSWATIAIFGMIAGDHLAHNRNGYEHYLYWLGAVLIVIGTAVGLFDPPRKELVSSSYALISSGAAAIMLMFLYYFIETKKVEWLIQRLRPLREFGIAALSAWILQYILASYFIWYFHIHEKLPFLYGASLATAMIVAVWLVIVTANKRGLALRI